MTDKELLELAAKAAGLDKMGGSYNEKSNCIMDYEGWDFDPLNDDGDALRLAVKLKIRWERHIVHPYVAAWANEVPGRFEEPEGGDPYAATRRAIVRAAAEIGKEKGHA